MLVVVVKRVELIFRYDDCESGIFWKFSCIWSYGLGINNLELELHISIVSGIEIIQDKHVLSISIVNDGIVNKFIGYLE